MRRRTAGPAAVALLAWALAAAPLLAAPPTPRQEVERALMCYCGCAELTVRACTCGTADAIRAEIDQRLGQGETPQQIVAAFVLRHGEKIRSAPVKSGFDLLAWITPFVALALAGGALVAVVRRWGRRPAPRPAGTAPGGPGRPGGASAPDAATLERIRSDIRDGF
jgi:cytochrome c-type biogenesis protein CcmH